MHDYDIRSKIGLRIKELRAERGVSQEEFANLIGMSRSYFGEGRPASATWPRSTWRR